MSGFVRSTRSFDHNLDGIRRYLVLYALMGDQIFLLAIKHHRQRSFDLKRFSMR
jgi:hypothetical protein